MFKEQPMLHKLTKNEIQSLKKLNNDNIINFVDIMRSTNNTYYVYEYCDGGNLFTLLKKKKFF